MTSTRTMNQVHIICSSLECGGTERTVANICRHLDAHDQIKPSVATLYSTDDFFQLPPRVARYRLDIGKSEENSTLRIGSFFSRLKILRNHLQRHRRDFFLVFGDHNALLVLIAGAGLNLRIAVAERQNPYSAALPWYWRMVRLFAYHLVDSLVVQTQAIATQWAAPRWPWTKIVVIPNAVEVPPPLTFESRRPNMVFVGRLNKLKGLYDLIKVLSNLNSISPKITCLVIGDGPEKANLQSMIEGLGLTNSVELLGSLTNPWEVANPGDIFVFPSYTEGFPNSLLEAMAHGLVPVSYDCPYGPKEIISNGVNGFLIPVGDHQSFLNRITTLISDEDLRLRLASAAHKRAKDFSIETLFRMWANLDTQTTD